NDFWLIDPAKYLDENDIQRYQNKTNAENVLRRLFNKPNDSNQNLITILLSKGIDPRSMIQGNSHSNIPIKVVAPAEDYYQELVKIMVEDFGMKTYEAADTSEYDENALPDETDVKSVIDVDDDQSHYNASSLVLLFEPGDGNKFLFTGDSNCASLTNMVDTYDGELQNITLLKVPHHGSKHNMTTEIIESLSPSMSIISAKGTKKHPSSGLVYWLSKSGHVYSTHKSIGGLYYRSNIDPREGNKSAIPLKNKSEN
ncbi:MAG: hypothetical protein KAI79_03200, partial [Bacteroidales bacterium]|nr:hypothetical protein [Bacteroidales bacterium]